MVHFGKILILIGIIITVAGLVFYFAGDKFGWLGHLPGDIQLVKKNIRIYIPITTMIIISIFLTFILYLIRKLF